MECVLVAQNASIDTDEVGTDSGSDLSQIDWRAEQTVDSTLNRVRQIFTSGHKPTKRQIALESKDAQSFLRQWDSLFLKDDILYRRHNLYGTTVNQLVLPEIYRDIAPVGLHDEAGHQGRDRTLSLVKSRFYWPGMDGDVEKKVRNCPRCIRQKSQAKTSANLALVESTFPMDLVCMDFLSLEISAGGYENILVITDISAVLLKPSLPRTRQPRPQPDFSLIILSAIMVSPPVFIVTRVATLRARSLRNCVPLPISISHGPRRTVLWAMECLSVLIRRCLICWELWRTIKSRTGSLMCRLWSTHITPLVMKALALRLII